MLKHLYRQTLENLKFEGVFLRNWSPCEVARANIKDVYTFIPHKLKGVVQPDIVERLQKFYRQMF